MARLGQSLWRRCFAFLLLGAVRLHPLSARAGRPSEGATVLTSGAQGGFRAGLCRDYRTKCRTLRSRSYLHFSIFRVRDLTFFVEPVRTDALGGFSDTDGRPFFDADSAVSDAELV